VGEVGRKDKHREWAYLGRKLWFFPVCSKNENARVGLRQIKRLPVILKVSAYRKLLTLKIRGLLKGSKRGTAVSAVFFIIRLHRLRAASSFIG
jgi:hypothetical protein